jgi:hypothetical protein
MVKSKRKSFGLAHTNATRAIFGLAALVLVLSISTLAQAETTQKGNLRVTVTGKLSPHNLPRSGAAPVAVSVDGQISTTDESPPPQLRQLKIEINSHGRLDYQGLPLCRIGQIQPASNSRALHACRSALVGQGSFAATISLPGQAPYPTQGRLLLYNGKEGGHQVLLGHIYNFHPFASSFVIVFQISTRRHGEYGTTLTANLAKALGDKRNLTGISMTLSRRYAYRGARRSFLSAGCPAAKGFPGATYSLARTSFAFAGGTTLSSTLPSSCGARG